MNSAYRDFCRCRSRFWIAIAGVVLCFAQLAPVAWAEIFGRVQGIVHDSQHRPVHGAEVSLSAPGGQLVQTVSTGMDGDFEFPAVPVGDYEVTAKASGFRPLTYRVSLTPASSPLLHFMLEVAGGSESVTVMAQDVANSDSMTPETTVSKAAITNTPGADRTNSLEMITTFVPGAYVTHDMLHMRGGHQVSWMIDGVQIPNTNIGSNLGAQIDPKDIESLDVERGSYSANTGDRTFGVFNVVPRNGFDRSREAELILSGGSFLQSNDQISFGDHTERFAYYASLNGNRSDFGLSPPTAAAQHGAANGFGGFTSLLYNRTARDQLRFVSQLRSDYFQIPYDPDPASAENQQYNSTGLRDGQHEMDGLAAFTWAHTFGTDVVLQLSPFYHYNRADYEPDPADLPVATTSDRASQYGGLQASIAGGIAHNMLGAGLYSFGQHDADTFGSLFNDGSAPSFRTADRLAGGLVEEYVSDTYRPWDWLTVLVGLRQSQFTGTFAEDATSPRVGIAMRVPRLRWVFRGFYGRMYQPPPLQSVSGPIARYADSQNTAFIPLHGERDEEHQFGVQIPVHGWLVDADTFQTRARNFLDHANLGESSIYFPVSIDGALIQAWELTIASPRGWRYGQAHLAYSNQVARQRGALTGGLVCAPIASPDCSGDFSYVPLDHDQRNTLSLLYSASLSHGVRASVSLAYGSGFHNASPDAQYPGNYLPAHTSVDFSASKALGETTTLSVNVLNVANQRVLLDNSLTFGGFHYSDSREVYGELRFRFHY